MSAPLPEALRKRLQELIKKGHSGRLGAQRLKLLPATGSRWSLAIRLTGHAKIARQGCPPGKGKLDPHREFLMGLLSQDGDMTMKDICVMSKNF